MSAYIIADGTMNHVVNAALFLRRRGNDCFPSLNGCNAQALGEALFRMNADAVAQRYEEPPEAPQDLWKLEEGEITDSKESLMAAAKAVSCLGYQCSEGDVPERELFKELDCLGSELLRLAAAHFPPSVSSKDKWHYATKEWNDAKTWG